MAPRCPQCRRGVEIGAPAFPFCSDRCRLLDLGNWLDERYIVRGAEEEESGASSRASLEHEEHASGVERKDRGEDKNA
jgi:endogenous inhibitor of DNA gyrase (YacG/DUF329 family)